MLAFIAICLGLPLLLYLLHWVGARYADYTASIYDTTVQKTSEALLKKLQAEYDIPQQSIKPFSRLKIRNTEFRNRVIKAATYEAMCDRDGVPCEELVSFHARMAEGGAGMCIVAYAAVSPAGRSFPAQLICREKSKRMMKQVVDAIHSNDSLACIQLTHAGYFSDRTLSEDSTHEQMSAQRLFNPAQFNFCRKMTATDKSKLATDFVSASRVAVEAGFDCVEIHCGHGYLLSQFLSPRLNPGISLAHRVAFPSEVLRLVKHALNGRAVLMVKLNLVDGTADGLTVEEACSIAESFAACGVDIIALSGGLILENGLFMLRGGVPLARMISATTDRMKSIALMLFGSFVIPYIPFKELYFRSSALCVLHTLRRWNSTKGKKMEHNVRVCIMGGVHSYNALRDAMEVDGFDLVQSGRAILRDPGIVKKWEGVSTSKLSRGYSTNEGWKSRDDELNAGVDSGSSMSECTTCNYCIVDATMRQKPIACVEW